MICIYIEERSRMILILNTIKRIDIIDVKRENCLRRQDCEVCEVQSRSKDLSDSRLIKGEFDLLRRLK